MKKFSLFALGCICAAALTACAPAPKVKPQPKVTAIPVSDQCPKLTGFYVGHYVDTTGLFPNTAFPINLYLKYQDGMVYGYTQSAADQKGARYGQKPYAVLWGKCKSNKISDLYIVHNRKTPCGDPATATSFLKPSSALTLQLNYENAMINANLIATLTPNASMLAQIVNKPLLSRAIQLAHTSIHTCH